MIGPSIRPVNPHEKNGLSGDSFSANTGAGSRGGGKEAMEFLETIVD